MFGTGGVAGKYVLRELPPVALCGLRALLAGWMLALIAIAQRPKAPERVRALERRDLPAVILAAFTGVVANQLLFMGGLARSTATNAVVLGATIPIFTTAIALAVGREKPRLDVVIGLLVAFVGALSVAGADAFSGSARYAVGNTMILCNCLSYSIYLVVTQRLVQKYSAASVVAWSFLLGGAVLFAIGLPQILESAPQVSPKTWLVLGYIIVFPTVGTYGLNTFALRTAPTSLVAAYINLQPLVGAILAWYVLAESPSLGTLAGGAMILLGLAIVSGRLRRARVDERKGARSS